MHHNRDLPGTECLPCSVFFYDQPAAIIDPDSFCLMGEPVLFKADGFADDDAALLIFFHPVLVRMMKVAHQAVDDFGTQEISIRIADAPRRVSDLGREVLFAEIDADADDDRAHLKALVRDQLAEDPRDLPAADKNVVHPFDPRFTGCERFDRLTDADGCIAGDALNALKALCQRKEQREIQPSFGRVEVMSASASAARLRLRYKQRGLIGERLRLPLCLVVGGVERGKTKNIDFLSFFGKTR